MQNNPFLHARRICLWFGAMLALGFLTGCEAVKITNLTPSSLPENPSHIYTLSARITTHTPAFIPGSLRGRVVVDGQSFDMQPSPIGGDVYTFDYQVGPGRTELAYYFLASYQLDHGGAPEVREAYTGVQHASIAGRYVLSLQANRGPVGARISVVGRGFTPEDVISLDGVTARTVFESPNALSFFVPPVDPNRNYQVQLQGANGTSMVGTFRVDAARLSVSPTSLNLASGESQALTFSLPNAAPRGGLLLDVTTDIRESVIMPEVVVPEGSNSVTVTVQGGSPGSGSLFLKGFGEGEIVIPVTVR